MNTFFHILTFGIIALLYTHFTIQNTAPDDISIFEASNESNERIQKICDNKHVLIFLRELETNKDDFCITTDADEPTTLHINDAKRVFEKSETPLLSTQNFVNLSTTNHKIISPPGSYFAGHNVMCGSKDAKTETLTHNYHRKFIEVVEGEIELRIVPFSKMANYQIDNNYMKYSFSSPSVLNQGELCIIPSGYLVNIPPNCFYNIRFICSYNYCVDYSYHSVVSLVSNLHHIAIYYMQQHNIQYVPDGIKTVDNTSKQLIPVEKKENDPETHKTQ